MLLLAVSHLNVKSISLLFNFAGTPQLPSSLALISNSTAIVVSWSAPLCTPADNYTIVYICRRLCDSNVSIFQNSTINTTILATIAAGTICTVFVTAMFGNYSRNTIISSINTTSEGKIYCIQLKKKS